MMICAAVLIAAFVGFGIGLYAGYRVGWDERGFVSQLDADEAVVRDALIAMSVGKVRP